jgi:ribosome biogenesis protein UTP30
MTADPQRTYKDIVANEAFPEELRSKIGRVIGMEKLKKKYKSYESKRQLLAEYDMFLADDRIYPALTEFLGKVFNSAKNKRPISISLTQQLPKDKDGKRPRVVRSPESLAKEIETALKATYVHLSSSATTSIKVGRLSQEPKQIQENIQAVVDKLVEKFVPRGWRNIRGLHVKGPTTVALPIWLADELWTDEAQVLEEPWKPTPREGPGKGAEKKRKWEEWENELLDDEEIAERRKAIKEAKKAKSKDEGSEKKTISKERRKKLKRDTLQAVQTPLIAN